MRENIGFTLNQKQVDILEIESQVECLKELVVNAMKDDSITYSEATAFLNKVHFDFMNVDDVK